MENFDGCPKTVLYSKLQCTVQSVILHTSLGSTSPSVSKVPALEKSFCAKYMNPAFCFTLFKNYKHTYTK